MKRFLLILIVLVITSCSKSSNLPYTYLDVEVSGLPGKLKLEELRGEWSSLNHAKIEATSFDYHQIYLNLSNVSDTGSIHGLAPENIRLTDAKGFSSTSIVSGRIRIKVRDAKKILGELDIVFEGNNQPGYNKRLSGEFGIVNE